MTNVFKNKKVLTAIGAVVGTVLVAVAAKKGMSKKTEKGEKPIDNVEYTVQDDQSATE